MHRIDVVGYLGRHHVLTLSHEWYMLNLKRLLSQLFLLCYTVAIYVKMILDLSCYTHLVPTWSIFRCFSRYHVLWLLCNRALFLLLTSMRDGDPVQRPRLRR